MDIARVHVERSESCAAILDVKALQKMPSINHSYFQWKRVLLLLLVAGGDQYKH